MGRHGVGTRGVCTVIGEDPRSLQKISWVLLNIASLQITYHLCTSDLSEGSDLPLCYFKFDVEILEVSTRAARFDGR